MKQKYIVALLSIVLLVTQEIPAQDTAVVQHTPRGRDSLLRMELKQAKYNLYKLLSQYQSLYHIYVQSGNGMQNLGSPLEVTWTDTAYRFSYASKINTVLHFSYLTDLNIKIYNANNSIQSSNNISFSQLKIGGIIFTVSAEQQYILNALKQHFINVQRLQNDLLFNMNMFEELAANYLSGGQRPVISEKQRKLILQAGAAAKLYEYEKSIWLNNRIISLHPTAYPDVYLNLAILQGETNRLHSAIYNMKKFLMFKPDSSLVAFGKTKISEWEIILNN